MFTAAAKHRQNAILTEIGVLLLPDHEYGILCQLNATM